MFVAVSKETKCSVTLPTYKWFFVCMRSQVVEQLIDIPKHLRTDFVLADIHKLMLGLVLTNESSDQEILAFWDVVLVIYQGWIELRARNNFYHRFSVYFEF